MIYHTCYRAGLTFMSIDVISPFNDISHTLKSRSYLHGARSHFIPKKIVLPTELICITKWFSLHSTLILILTQTGWLLYNPSFVGGGIKTIKHQEFTRSLLMELYDMWKLWIIPYNFQQFCVKPLYICEHDLRVNRSIIQIY